MIAALLALLLQEKSPDRPLQGPAERCGSEIPWLDDLDAAVRESQKTGKPILWWVTDVDGSPMDRKLVLRKYMQAGPWMMPDIVSIVGRRFVPLRMASEGNLDVVPMKFVEPGFVVLDAQLKDLLRLDRLALFNEALLRARLLRVLKTRPQGTTAEELFAEGAYEEALKRNPNAPLRARILRRLGRDFTLDDLPPEEQALEFLAKGDAAAAEKALASAKSEHARYLRGVALHLACRDDEGRAVWKKLVEEKPDSRWAWKASAELGRDGPFVRGFEVFAAPAKGIPAALRYLLSMQRSHGGWDDSNYNFGGDDSLPNVYVATTAIVATALLEWKDADPRIPAALERADQFLRDDSHLAPEDDDEMIWAHAYRLFYFARIKDKKMVQAMVDALAKLQQRSGIFAHEHYPNPFLTATVLQALWQAKQAGAAVPDATVKRAVDALRNCRSDKGVFSYQYPGRGTAVQGGAGRMPHCELALVLWGAGTDESLKVAVDASLKHHALLERVRKYDDHADSYANGGFFFWYDILSRAEAIVRLKDRAASEKLIATILEIAEPDGAWVDSHELGRPYGTAMALLALKRLGAK